VQVVGFDQAESGFVVADQVHLVHGHHQMLGAHHVGELGVALRLRQHAAARVDQDDRQVGGRGGGDHVARVLLVAGRVGDDVLAGAGREVAVGDVDGDALLALGQQAVGEQRQVGGGQAALRRSLLDGVQRVGEDGLGVVEQPADQRALAVVHAAAGQEAQQAMVDVLLEFRNVFDGAHQK